MNAHFNALGYTEKYVLESACMEIRFERVRSLKKYSFLIVLIDCPNSNEFRKILCSSVNPTQYKNHSSFFLAKIELSYCLYLKYS